MPDNRRTINKPGEFIPGVNFKDVEYTIVLVTGGFDPLHSGHIEYFKAAASYGNILLVGVNSDAWLARKKGRSFMPIDERADIISHLGMVGGVVRFDDEFDADGSACNFIEMTLKNYPTANVIFCNGGDRNDGNCPEMSVQDPRLKFVFGVGGENKKNSSSWILKEWEAPKVEREWGHYRNLYKGDGFQVKELVIAPHSKLSMQRHKHRSETWNLVSGTAHVLTSTNNSDPTDGAKRQQLTPPNPVDIPKGVWHQGCNDSDEPAHIVEVWKGPSELLGEEDIERWD
jgi:cytidyltransferase-like protein